MLHQNFENFSGPSGLSHCYWCLQNLSAAPTTFTLPSLCHCPSAGHTPSTLSSHLFSPPLCNLLNLCVVTQSLIAQTWIISLTSSCCSSCSFIPTPCCLKPSLLLPTQLHTAVNSSPCMKTSPRRPSTAHLCAASLLRSPLITLLATSSLTIPCRKLPYATTHIHIHALPPFAAHGYHYLCIPL